MCGWGREGSLGGDSKEQTQRVSNVYITLETHKHARLTLSIAGFGRQELLVKSLREGGGLYGVEGVDTQKQDRQVAVTKTTGGRNKLRFLSGVSLHSAPTD